MKNEGGFSFIELATVMVIILGLAGISLGAFRSYRKQGYEATLQTTFHDARNAIEAGQADNEDLQAANLTAWTDGTGTFRGQNVQQFIPGLVATENTWVFVQHNGECAVAGDSVCSAGTACCIVDEVFAKHCKGQVATNWITWNNGTVTKIQWDNMGC